MRIRASTGDATAVSDLFAGGSVILSLSKDGHE